MSVRLSTFLILLFLGGFTKAQIQVPQEQKSFYAVVEATWCGYCGWYGIPTTNDLSNQAGDKAIFLSLHAASSSELHSPTADGLNTGVLATSGTPSFTLNGENLGYYSANLPTNILNQINSNYSATTTDVNAGFEWYIQDDSIYVETLTKFFSDQTGEFFVGVYLSEDSIWEYQSNYDPETPNGNVFHSHVLRSAFTSNAFGNEIASGMINAGSEFTNRQALKIDPSWNMDQIHIYTMVWQRTNSNYTFKNANDKGLQVINTSATNIRNTAQFDVYPNPVNSELTIALNEIPNDSYSIQLFNSIGQTVLELTPEKGKSTFRMDLSELNDGIYYINISSINGNQTRRILKQ